MRASLWGRRWLPALGAGATVVLVAALLARALWPPVAAGHPVAVPAAGAPADLQPGGRWVRAGLTLQTDSLLQDPLQAGVLLAGTLHGIWRSLDGGATWQRRGDSRLAGVEINSLAASSGGGAVVAGGLNGGVYLSTQPDRQEWRLIGSMPGANPVFSVAIAPGQGETVLAGTFGGLYQGRHDHGGWRWRRVAQTADNAAVTSITWGPGRVGFVFASVFASWPPVLASHDGGATWQPDVAGLPRHMPVQSLLPLAGAPPQVILSTMGTGVWSRMATGTGAWRDISAGLPLRHAMALARLPGQRGVVVYAGTMGNGVYVRAGGGHWQRLGRGLDGAEYSVLSLVATGGGHPHLLAATIRGVFRYVPPARP